MTAPRLVHLMDTASRGRICSDGQKTSPNALTLFWPAVTCDRCKVIMARDRLR